MGRTATRADDQDGTTKGTSWDAAKLVDRYRTGWSEHSAQCLAVLDERGPEALAEMIRRENRGKETT
jgi:hypothetical protein